MANPVNVPEAVWQAELPFTPQLLEFAPGLALALGAGERDGAPAVIASIRYRMPDPVVRRYRGRIVPAIFVVAIDAASGEVFEAACVAQDAAPTTFNRAAAPQSALGAPAVGGVVNVDIVAQLGLPPGAARYLVFAWLDEWASSPKGLELGANPKRAVSSVRQPPNAPGAVRRAASTPSTGGQPIDLQRGAAAGTFAASWNAAMPTPVVLLGYGLDERKVHWEVVATAAAREAMTGAAEVALPAFMKSASPSAGALALVAGGQVRAIASVTP